MMLGAVAMRLALALGLVLALGMARAADVFEQATAGPVHPVDTRYLGFHAGYLVPVAGQPQRRQTAWPGVPIGGYRLWDAYVRWADLQPERGRWRWERLDALVDLARRHDAQVLYVLGSTPRWASSRPDEACPYHLGCSAEPADLADWEDYVRAVVRRYRGRIAAYELWNEPKFQDGSGQRPKGFFSGSVEQMVAMARIARRVVSQEDPQALLLSPGFDGGPKWMEMFLAAGGASLVDVIAYHFYANDAEHFARQVVAVRAAMRRQGVERLPLWNTESGFEASDGEGPTSLPGSRRLGRADAAALLAQTLVLGAAAGIERFYVYSWDHLRMGMVDAAGNRLPGYAAVERVMQWLSGATVESCSAERGEVVRCDAVRQGVRYSIAWALRGDREWRPDEKGGRRPGAVASLLDGDGKGRVEGGGVRLGSAPVRLEWEPVR